MAVTVTSLKTRGAFARCYRCGRRADNDLLRLYACSQPGDERLGTVIRVGWAVSRRLGTAVRRNRLRRVLREACRQFMAEARGNWDVVIVPRPGARGASAQALRSALRRLLAGVGIC